MTGKITSYDSFEEALILCIESCSKSKKDIALYMWPPTSEEKWEQSYRRLMDALYGRYKLSAEEMIKLMLYCDRYDLLYFIADEVMHNRPTQKTIESEARELQEAFEESVEKLSKVYRKTKSFLEKRKKLESMRNGQEKFMHSLNKIFDMDDLKK